MALSANNLRGTFTALVTPFDESGSRIDEVSFQRLIERQLRAGINGLVVGGSTGEASSLTLREYEQAVGLTRHHAAKIPVVAGLSLSSTDRAVEVAQLAKGAGADALLVAAPPYIKPTQEGVYQHAKAIASASGLPIIAYNIPGRSCVNIAPATVARMANDGFAIGVKDAGGSMDDTLDLLAAVPRGFSVLAGDDSLIWPIMSCGGVGTISASANVAPDAFLALTKAANSGDIETARRLQLSLLPLIRALFVEPNPVPAKAALWMAKVIDWPTVRLPLIRASESTIERLKAVMS